MGVLCDEAGTKNAHFCSKKIRTFCTGQTKITRIASKETATVDIMALFIIEALST